MIIEGMALGITILGTGTSQGVPVIGCDCPVCQSNDPRDKRLRTSALLSKNGKHIAIDIGPDFRQQMLRAKPSYLDAIIMTHEHNDHTAGLDDVRPYNFMRRQDMPIYSEPRVADAFRVRFPYVFDKEPYPGAPMVRLHTISAEASFQAAGMEIIPIRIMHGRLPILGFRIDDFAYLTDVKTIPQEEFVKLENLHTLVINALHHSVHFTHMNLEESLAMIERIKPKRAFLTHLSHRMGLHAEIEKDLPNGVKIAYDGLQIAMP